MAEQIWIRIRYFGLDAENHELELVALGQSLQGAGRMIDMATSLVLPPVDRSFGFRVLATQPREGSFEILAVLATLQPFLPAVVGGAQKAIEGLVNYAVSRLTKKEDVAGRAMDFAQKAIEEMGMTSRAAIEAVASMAEVPKTAARSFLAPIGKSCKYTLIGHEETGAIPFDITDREAIEAQPIEVGAQAQFDILISELDIINKTCKFSVRGGNESRRFFGTITDPAVGIPNNPYSSSLSENRWLTVSAKPELSDGKITRLYISDSL